MILLTIAAVPVNHSAVNFALLHGMLPRHHCPNPVEADTWVHEDCHLNTARPVMFCTETRANKKVKAFTCATTGPGQG